MIEIDPASPTPLYLQIAEQVRRLIALGALRPGERLPAVRELAVRARVNRNTAARAIQQLEADGSGADPGGAGHLRRGRTGPGGPGPPRCRRGRRGSTGLLVEAHTLGMPLEELGWRLSRRIDDFRRRRCEQAAPRGGAPGRIGGAGMSEPALVFEQGDPPLRPQGRAAGARPHRRARHGPRSRGPQRRGQDDHAAPGPRPASSRRGHDPRSGPRSRDPRACELRSRVGLLSEESALYPWMSVQEIVDFAAALHPRWDAGAGRLPGRAAGAGAGGEDQDALPRNAGQGRPGPGRRLPARGPAAGRPHRRTGSARAPGDPARACWRPCPTRVAPWSTPPTWFTTSSAWPTVIAVLDEGRLQLEGPLEKIKARTRRARAVFEDGGSDRASRLAGRSTCVRGGAGADRGRRERATASWTPSCAARAPARWRSSSLSLEEILVACLRRGGAAEEEHV